MLVLVNKPSGYTSFDLIKKLKRLYPGEKIGHAGTLDPLATGLMIVAIGKDTKKLHSLTGLDKTYIATIDFSKTSDTWDTDYWKEYAELSLEDLEAPKQETLDALLSSRIGTHPFPLTPFSARKRKGKKLYEYARAGEPIFIDSPMTILSYAIISYSFPILKVRLEVGSGTYIRSIAHWLGKSCGCGGILTALHRDSIGVHGPLKSVAS